MAKQASIELKNLTKEYVTHEGSGTFLAVDHINVNIESGEFVTLLGPSGCGKTTTLRMIAGFESVSDGDILLDGTRINEMTPDKRDSSMVFQSYSAWLLPGRLSWNRLSCFLTNLYPTWTRNSGCICAKR